MAWRLELAAAYTPSAVTTLMAATHSENITQKRWPMLAYLAMGQARRNDTCMKKNLRTCLLRARFEGERITNRSSGGRRRRGLLVQIGDAVARAVDGVEQRPRVRLVDHAPQVVEVRTQRVGIGQRVAPDFALDVVARHHARRFAHQDREEFQPDWRHLQLFAVAHDPERRGIQGQVANLVDLAGNLSPLAPDQGADARFEFA